MTMIAEPKGKLATIEEVAQIQQMLGRKFEATDVTDALYDAALHYARLYDGSFDFMIDMAYNARRNRLSNGQAKAVLNCMAAAGRKALEATAPKPEPDELVDPNHVPNGIFAVGDTIFRIEEIGFGDFPEGTRSIKVKVDKRHDRDRSWEYFARLTPDDQIVVSRKQAYRIEEAEAAKALFASDDPLAFGFAYSLLSGKCFVCGTELSDPISIKSFIGPVCAKRLGISREGLDGEERAKAAAKVLIEAVG